MFALCICLSVCVLQNLPFLEACFMETLRLYPSVPSTFKISLGPDVLPDGTRIPANCVCVCVLLSVYVFRFVCACVCVLLGFCVCECGHLYAGEVAYNPYCFGRDPKCMHICFRFACVCVHVRARHPHRMRSPSIVRISLSFLPYAQYFALRAWHCIIHAMLHALCTESAQHSL